MVQKARISFLVLIHILIILHIYVWGSTRIGSIDFQEFFHSFLKLGIINSGVLLVLFAFTFTLIFGRFFCGWACHFGAIQELSYYILKKLNIKTVTIDSKLVTLLPIIILFNYYYKHPERESGAFTKPTIEIYDYITKNTKHEDIIIFRKPRLMSLMTGRRSIANLQFLEPQLEKLTGNIWIVDNVAGRLETNYITSGKKQSYLEEIGEKFEDKEEMLENQQFRILKVNFKKFN